MFPGIFLNRIMQKTTIVLATHNPHKARELLVALESLPIALKTLDDFPEITDIQETGTTLLENSLIKAHTVHEKTGLPAIADDTGLEVEALNGAPGVTAARFAGEHATFDDNINKLLHQLKDKSKEERSAQFRSVISYVDKTRELWAEGSIKGFILEKRKGADGFGYDPVFFVPEMNKTFAEMSDNEKNSISHRARAVHAIKNKLEFLANSAQQRSIV